MRTGIVYCTLCAINCQRSILPWWLRNSDTTMTETSQSVPPQIMMYGLKIINGGIAGIVGVTCVFPMDLVKTRLQNQRSQGLQQYSGIYDCALKTWRSCGKSFSHKFRGLYSGSGVNLLLITPEKAIKLVANDYFRRRLAEPGESTLPLSRGMLAGAGAGFCQIIVTTPMELIKIQMQDAGRTQVQLNGNRLNSVSLVANLLRQKGIFGLYKGFFPTMARDVSFSVLYFPLFAFLDLLGPRSNDNSGNATFYVSFVAGLTAGALASFAVTPLDVIKTRMQLINMGKGEIQYTSIANALVQIVKHEGWAALLKGAVCRMMVMAPLFGIAQMVYYIGIAELLFGVNKVPH